MRERLAELWERPGIRLLAYVVFAVSMFALFLLLTFPERRVRQIVTVQLEKALGHQYDVTIAELGMWRLTGAKFEGVQLKERVSATERVGVEGGLAKQIYIERISARFAPLGSLLRRGATVNYQVDIGGGVLEGSFTQSSSRRLVTVQSDELDLRQSTLLASLLGIPVFGQLDTDIELELHPSRPVLTGGEIALTGRQFTVGPTTLNADSLPVALDVPMTNFGNIVVRAHVESDEGGKDPRLVIDEFQTRGRDINTEIWGHVELGAQMGRSRPRLEMRLQVNEEYVTANSLGVVFNMAEFRKGRHQDWYGFTLGGTFQDLAFRGAATAARGPTEQAAEPAEEAQD
ncbi:type II secretion system protein GspN [Lujinxingia litoralis]|uniref:Type II secretion system protein GspN n=1 Tax=Lujinxingia litoralis TaxID=2211119 RepID=A0A328C6Z8_9DELT|nr:type II secretion system protein GspN [Lujinxingia litoralis]RAL22822.1 type II secretion system protein GspN [Lujinxingia litoralis]